MKKLVDILSEIQISDPRLRIGAYIKSPNDVWVIYKIKNGIYNIKNPYEFKLHGTKEQIKELIKDGSWSYSNKDEFENKRLSEIQIKQLNLRDKVEMLGHDLIQSGRTYWMNKVINATNEYWPDCLIILNDKQLLSLYKELLELKKNAKD